MACKIKTWRPIFTILVVLNTVLVVLCTPQVPCYFIFGDSLVDNGNNNDRNTVAKANYSPFGIDFRYGITGRFTNGRTIADFIAEFLGFENYIPPFATTEGEEIIRGLNYASGGAEILDDTGRKLGDVISLNMQLQHHQTTLSKITKLLGTESATKEYLSKCLYQVGMGSNDYINAQQDYNTSSMYLPHQYADLLIQQYSKQLETLYMYGARKVVVFDIGLIGYTPGARSRGNMKSTTYLNSMVELFNYRLKLLIDDINTRLPSAKFICIISESTMQGLPEMFKVTDAPCCESITNITGQCASESAICSNRTEYFFYDQFHPTEYVNSFTASRAYKRHLPTDAYPLDISQLVQLE